MSDPRDLNLHSKADMDLVRALRGMLADARAVARELRVRGYLVQIPEDAERPMVAKIVREETA